MLEAVAVATGQFIAGLISDSLADRRHSRRAAMQELRELAETAGIPDELASAVQAWIDRPDVVAQLSTVTSATIEEVIAAVIEPLRYELLAIQTETDPGDAETIIRNILDDPSFLAVGTQAARRKVLDGLEQLLAGQDVIYGELLESTVARLDHARREGNAALVACDFGEAARCFEVQADEAKRLRANGLEAASLAKAVTSLANQLFGPIAPIEAERVRLRMRALTARREQLVTDGPPLWRLAALISEIEGDETEAIVHLQNIMASDAATDRERADAWCRLVNIASRASDHLQLEKALQSRPAEPDEPEIGMVMANVEIRALDALGRVTLSAVSRYLDRLERAIEADPDLAERSLLDLSELRFHAPPSTDIERALDESTLTLARAVGNHLAAIGALLGLARLDAAEGNSSVVRERIDEVKELLARGSVSHAAPTAVLGQVSLHIGQVLLVDYATSGVEDRDSPVLAEALSSLRAAQGYAVASNAPRTVLAEIELHLGRAELFRGELAAAIEHQASAARSPAVAPSANMMQAEILLALGRWEESRELASRVFRQAAGQPVADFARRMLEHIDADIEPLLKWYDSSDARALVAEAKASSPRAVVAQLTRSLLRLWDDADGDGSEAFLLDYWARGNFIRIAHALSVTGSDSIAVDASTVDEIRTACRILCPLFETVVIKWCGDVVTGMAIGSIPEDFAGPGGHGFIFAGGLSLAPRQPGGTPGAVMMCPNCSRLPADVIALLVGDARDLFASGRLVVAPAGLVGCHSAAIGWSDGLLVDRLLGGAVLATSATAPRNLDRVLELGSTSIPYAAQIPLSELPELLAEMERELLPFRTRVFELLSQGRLGIGDWAGNKTAQLEVQVAFRELDAALRHDLGARGETTRSQAVAPAMSSAGPRTTNIASSASILGASQRDTGSWFPLWRLAGDDGVEWSPVRHWSSTTGSKGTRATWLCPGTHGFAAPTVIG